VILDEIGRGTSTFDGLSIAWECRGISARRCTRPCSVRYSHYHEMTELEMVCAGREEFQCGGFANGTIGSFFLRKIQKGCSRQELWASK